MSIETDLDSRLLEVSQRLADGGEIDWDSVARDIDPALVSSLRELETLTSAMFTIREGVNRAAETSTERFAHLTLIDEIGRGANGAVWRAHDPVMNRDVALKLCDPSGARNDVLLREARLMAKVDHPNVLKVHGAIEENGVVGFWSDLLEGESLDEWSASHPKLNARELAAVGGELCVALAAIHDVGLVHGDIKPANVRRHSSGRWVLVDFGSSTTESAAVLLAGTPLYLAPEIFAGEVASRRTDVYALGVLLFHLATHRYPVEGMVIADLAVKHETGSRLRLLDLRPDLPAPLIATIEKAMQPAAEDRQQTAGELAAGLAPASIGKGRVVVTPRWALAAAAVLAIVAVFAGLGSREAARLSAVPKIDLMRVVAGNDEPLQDGDSIAPGDTLALRFRSTRSEYVYVMNEDAHGEVFQLFPVETMSLANPLPMNTTLRLPGSMGGKQLDWQVTSQGGVEHFYVVVSPVALPQVASLGIAQASASKIPSTIGGLDSLAMGPMRGVGGLVERDIGAVNDKSLTGRLIDQIEAEHDDIYVRRIHLRNP